MTQESKIWFSHNEHVWNAEMKLWTPDVKMNKEDQVIWSWDNCFISGVKISEKKIRVIVRSKGKIKVRTDIEKNEEQIVSFVYFFDVSSIPKLEIEDFKIPPNSYQKLSEYSGKRRVLKLINETNHNWEENESDERKNQCEIWDWVSDSDSEMDAVCEKLKNILQEQYDSEKPLVETPVDVQPVTSKPQKKIYPIIYQPAIDTTKNFLRQMHIHEIDENLFEITLVFNNEALREHKILNKVYEDLRKVIYGRTKDIETFHIVLENSEPKKFNFEGIYSKNDNIEKDSTHGDKKSWRNLWIVPKRPIRQYYSSTQFPKIFVNTSNHALAGKDNNPQIWKWEYISWGKDLPIGVGIKSRKDIEQELTSENEFRHVVKELKDRFGKLGNWKLGTK